VSPDGSIQPLDVESIIASWTSIAYRSACIDLAIELAATAKPRRPSKAAKRRRILLVVQSSPVAQSLLTVADTWLQKMAFWRMRHWVAAERGGKHE
jgi:hypothetical protein